MRVILEMTYKYWRRSVLKATQTVLWDYFIPFFHRSQIEAAVSMLFCFLPYATYTYIIHWDLYAAQVIIITSHPQTESQWWMEPGAPFWLSLCC